MHHLVTLHIEEPVPFAGFPGDVRLVGMLHTPRIFFQVPGSVDDADLVGADAADLFEGVVIRVTVPEGHDEFVDEGQDGSDGLPDRIIQFGGVAHHGESTNGHVRVF